MGFSVIFKKYLRQCLIFSIGILSCLISAQSFASNYASIDFGMTATSDGCITSDKIPQKAKIQIEIKQLPKNTRNESIVLFSVAKEKRVRRVLFNKVHRWSSKVVRQNDFLNYSLAKSMFVGIGIRSSSKGINNYKNAKAVKKNSGYELTFESMLGKTWVLDVNIIDG